MRRKDREVTEHKMMEEFIADCHCCRIGFNDDGEVYIVPMNFGYEIEDGMDVFYFHCAKEGRKLDIIRKNPKVGFELDYHYKLKVGEQACSCSARFRSLIGTGTIGFVEELEAKKKGLISLMKQTTKRADWEFVPEMLEKVCVLKLAVESMTCKEHL